MITESQADKCQYLAQSTCSTGRGPEVCIEDHQIKATEAGGDSMHILNSSSQTGMLTWFGSDTTMVASYYDCRNN